MRSPVSRLTVKTGGDEPEVRPPGERVGEGTAGIGASLGRFVELILPTGLLCTLCGRVCSSIFPETDVTFDAETDGGDDKGGGDDADDDDDDDEDDDGDDFSPER